MNINIIATGKLKEDYLRSACAEYEKRLSSFGKVSVWELEPERLSDNPSQAEITAALKTEAEHITKKLSSGGFLIALCIEGKQISSEQLAQRISDAAINGKSALDIVIGSSFGLDDSIKNRADMKLSMSAMTFPHQLARVMISEQIYRAFSILNNKRYHK